jgi:hypothetical protein
MKPVSSYIKAKNVEERLDQAIQDGNNLAGWTEESQKLNTDIQSVSTQLADVAAKLPKKANNYNSVSDMKLDNSLKIGMCCETLGYYSRNDGGKATYYILDYELGSHYCEKLNNGLWAILVDNGEFNIKQCGAYGDWSSHPASSVFTTLAEAQAVYPDCVTLEDEIDGLVIQKCLNKIVRNIFIPKGGYSVNTTLIVKNEGFKIYGEGKRLTRITYTKTTGDLFSVVGKPTTEFRDISLWSTSYNANIKGVVDGVTNRAIYFNSSIRCDVRDVKINGFDYALKFENLCYNTVLERLDLDGNNVGLYGADDFNDIVIEKVRCMQNKDGMIIGHGRSVNVSNSLFEKNGRAVIKEDFGDFTISNTYFERHDTNAIRVRPKNGVYPSIFNLERCSMWREWDGTEITIECEEDCIVNMKHNLFMNNSSTNPITTYVLGHVGLPGGAPVAKVNFTHNRLMYGMQIANAGALASGNIIVD